MLCPHRRVAIALVSVFALAVLSFGCHGAAPRLPHPASVSPPHPPKAPREITLDTDHIPAQARAVAIASAAVASTAVERGAVESGAVTHTGTTCKLPAERAAPGLYVSDAAAAGRIALTFDDGPFARQTPAVLDRLAEHGFTAAFFVLGRNIHRATYAVLQRMEAEGHVIASHSYNHDVFMATRPKATDYIRGQHETTRTLIDIALLARSSDDFDELYKGTFDSEPGVWLKASALRSWRAHRARYEALMAARGRTSLRYDVRFSRPPAGNPYHDTAPEPRKHYDTAITRAGMLNILWHGESGDVHAKRGSEFAFLHDNIRRGAKHGGVLLIHDYIRKDALGAALAWLSKSGTEVISLETAIQQKYACSSEQLLSHRLVVSR